MMTTGTKTRDRRRKPPPGAVADAKLFEAIRNYHAAVARCRGTEVCGEAVALEAVLRIQPKTLAGCSAVLHTLQHFADLTDAAPFHDWTGDLRERGSKLFGRLAKAVAL